MKNLQELMDYLASHYVFTEEEYPSIRGRDTADVLKFSVNHLLVHMMKSMGKVAAVCEEYDHAEIDTLPVPAIREAAIKILINSLKLAQEVGLGAEEILSMAPTVIKR